MLTSLLSIGVVVFAVILHIVLNAMEKAKLAQEMLGGILTLYLAEKMDEETYEKSRKKVIDNLTPFQKWVFNKKYRR